MSGAVPMIEPRMFCGRRVQFERVAAKYAENIFGGIVYGAVKPLHDVAFPLAWVGLSVLGGETWYEAWLSPQPVTVRRDGRIVMASDGRLLFGSLSLPESAGLDLSAPRRRSSGGEPPERRIRRDGAYRLFAGGRLPSRFVDRD